jgi:hypothetical protein
VPDWSLFLKERYRAKDEILIKEKSFISLRILLKNFKEKIRTMVIQAQRTGHFDLIDLKVE